MYDHTQSLVCRTHSNVVFLNWSLPRSPPLIRRRPKIPCCKETTSCAFTYGPDRWWTEKLEKERNITPSSEKGSKGRTPFFGIPVSTTDRTILPLVPSSQPPLNLRRWIKLGGGWKDSRNQVVTRQRPLLRSKRQRIKEVRMEAGEISQ